MKKLNLELKVNKEEFKKKLKVKDGKNGENGKDGLDGSPDTGKQIVQKINDLPIRNDSQIDVSHIKNLTRAINNAGAIPAGGASIGGAVTGGTAGALLAINPVGILTQILDVAAGRPLISGGLLTLPSYATDPTTADALADVIWGASVATQKVLVLQAKASQSANVFEVQNSVAALRAAIDSSGNMVLQKNISASFQFGTGATTFAPKFLNAGNGILNIYANDNGGNPALRISNIHDFTFKAQVSAGANGDVFIVDNEPGAVAAGRLMFVWREAGVNKCGFVSGGGLAANVNSENVDSYIKGDNDPNLFYVLAVTDRVGIGTNTPQGKFDITTPATNDDINYWFQQDRVATTDATATTLGTFAITASRTYVMEARVIARRTGGTGGTADDGAAYVIRAAYTTKAGTVTLLGAVNADYTGEDQAAWDATFVISGTNVILQVTGAANNNVTWHATTKVSWVGT